MAVRIEIIQVIGFRSKTCVTALVAVRIEIYFANNLICIFAVTALVAVRIEIDTTHSLFPPGMGHRPCGGED